MKALLLIPAFFIYLIGFSQAHESSSADSVFLVVDKQPEFPGGPDKFDEFIKLYMHNTELSTGRIVVEFVVETDGSLTGFHLLKGLCQKCDTEALRVLQASPKWIPGENDGRKVRVKYSVTIIY